MDGNDSLRILHIGKFYPPHSGGMESHLQTLSRELKRHVDIEVLVANEHRRDELTWDRGIKITRVGTQARISSAPVCFGLARKIKRAHADIVHLHWPNPPAALAFFASGYRGPLVLTYHSDIVRQKLMAKVFQPFLQQLLKRSSSIVASSSRYVATSAILSNYTDRCRVIPFGIPPDEFNTRDERAVNEIRKQFGPRLILSVGRLIYYKGFQYLIEAMRHIDGHLVIIGDGPLRTELANQVARLGLQQKVTLLGQVDDIAPYYHAAHVFALASVARSEAFGIVQLEAMACGKPVVNTNLDSGVPWVSQDGVTGITVPPRDPFALAAAITKLLDDDSLRAEYGQAARLRVEKEFTQDLMIARLLETYREVLRVPVAEQSAATELEEWHGRPARDIHAQDARATSN